MQTVIRQRPWLTLFFIVLGIGVLNTVSKVLPVRDIVSVVVYGYIRVQSFFLKPIISMIETIRSIRTLKEDIKILTAQNQQLTADLVALHGQQEFVYDTQDLIEFQKRYQDYHKILVQVLLKQFSEYGHFFLLDAGAKQGVEPDMIAVVKNCLIGRVSEVFPYHCKVVLLTDRSCKVAVFCAKTKTEGIYEGSSAEQVGVLTHVSHFEKLEQNDLLITSGQGLVFPRGFGVGKIERFQTQDVYQQVKVKPLLDLNTITYCYLMRKGTERTELTEQVS